MKLSIKKFALPAEYLKTYKFNFFFYILSVLVVFTTLQIFYRFIDHSPFRLFETDVWPILYSLTFSLLVTSPYFFIKRKKTLFFVFIILFDLILLSNILYYRTYKSLITIYTFQQVDNLKGLGPCIIASFRNFDFFYILPTLILIASYFFYFKEKLIISNFTFRIKAWAIITLPFVCLIGYNIYDSHKNNELESNIDIFRYYPCYGTACYSPAAYWAFQIYDYWDTYNNKDLSSEDLKEIKLWIDGQEKPKGINTADNNKTNKNLIFILVESLESWPIGCKIGTSEVTPNLNRIIKEEKNIYASKVLTQVKDGESSDAQLIINTGLLPVNTGSAFFRFSHQKYFSLAKALKEKSNYQSMTIMGYAPAFWNQGEMNPQLGYDSLISSNELNMTDVFGMGLSDESLFKQTLSRIKEMLQPFFAQVVTLSSHMPFDIPKERQTISLPHDLPPVMANYLTSINYVDKAIGQFIADLKKNGLFDKSIVVITGDHNALADDQRKEFLKNKHLAKTLSKERFVPLLILNSPVRLKYDRVIGQIDIYPTLLDVLDLKNYEWRGLGNSLLSDARKSYAVDARNLVVGDTSRISSEKLRYSKNAWRISNLIICKNYFKQMEILAVHQGNRK